jgi:predicted amidohydrolase YtcJ
MRQALDSVAPGNPVYLRTWGHGTVLNSKALEILGIHDADKDPLGGWYSRASDGKITGALYEYAQWPAWYAVAVSEPGKLIESLRSYAMEEVKAGITTVQNMGSMIAPSMISEIFRRADLPVRVRIIPMPGTTAEGRDLVSWKNVSPHPAELTYTSGIKYLIDGTPLEQNALFKRPYPGTNEWYGKLSMPVDTITRILHEALTSDLQLMIHITGDSSMAIVLSLMKQMAPGEVWKGKRVRIEHNATATITDAETDLIKELGVLIMHSPSWNHSGHLRSFLEKGIAVGISPDGTTNPFRDLMIITSQQTNPYENITREQAVIAYTKTNAFAEFKEKEKGTLVKGMLADLAVLSQDIFTVPDGQLPATQSVLTMVNGKIVFQK